MTQKKYYVKSDISEDILQSFINYWTKKEIPDIKLYNLFEFEQLSQEFDIMKPVIQMFRKIALKSLPMFKNKELNRIKSEKIQNLNQNEAKYQQNIQYLLKNSRYSIIHNDPKDKIRLKDAMSSNNTKMTRYLIESLMIPPSLEVLENGWCAGVEKLIDIKIMKNQKNFLNYNSDFILGKSDLKNDIFDTLVFARRNITNAVIPSSIKYIFNFAFYECKQLIDVQFQENSQLLSIGICAFFNCSFQNFTLPKHVFEIKEKCFSSNSQLNTFKVPDDSELKYMKDAFLFTSIKNISIPSDIDFDDSFIENENLGRIELIPRPN